MPQSLPTRRLCVLVEAGGTPCALDALCVRGVETVEGAAPLKDLSQLLGGTPEPRPGLTVVLEVPTGLVLHVGKVHGVVDMAQARSHALPAGVSPRLARVVRGALELDGLLFLDVDLLALEGEAPPVDPPAAPPRQDALPPGPSLVFRTGDAVWAVPLAVVTQVVPAAGMIHTPGQTVALLAHGGALWPVHSLSGAVTGTGSVVLAEQSGRPLGLLADEVLGIFDQLQPAGHPASWSVPGATWGASGLDLSLLFA